MTDFKYSDPARAMHFTHVHWGFTPEPDEILFAQYRPEPTLPQRFTAAIRRVLGK